MIFNPGDEVMYPLRGDLQDLRQKKGVEVDVKGWGDVMEGASRRMSLFDPDVGADGIAQFFKGVATVCTKLFNAVEVGLSLTGRTVLTCSRIMRISGRKISNKHSSFE